MSRFETLYLKLPTSLQNIACSAVGWRNQRLRFGGDYPELLRQYESRSMWSAEQLAEFRDQRLHAFVKHAAETTPFYRQMFRQRQIDPDSIRTLEDLRQLPVTTKQDVQQRTQEFVSTAVKRSRRFAAHTSGTTGGGLKFCTTRAAIQEQWAACWRYRRWHGMQMGEWHAYFGGRSIVPIEQKTPPYWRTNRPGQQILFSGFHMSNRTLGSYVDELRRSRPLWLHGYPSLIALLASYILDHNLKLGYEIRWVTVSSENLLPQQNQLIEQAFGVRPMQHYAMGEAVANFSECPRGRMHVDEDFAATEFLPSGDGVGGKLLGTNFSNLAFPLLRYDVQDQAGLSHESCDCGRSGRLVQALDGRQEDYVVLANGTRIGRMDHVFKDMVNIREAQIVQRQVGQIILRVVRGVNYSAADEQQLLREAHQRVGDNVDVTIEYVEALTRSVIGKLRLVLSELPAGQITHPQPTA